MNIIEVFKKFPDQDTCLSYLEQVRWGNKPVCPYCKSDNTYKLDGENRHRHHCNGCHRSFRVTVGTIFHRTHLPLQKWFLAITLMLNAKKGISSRQLARDLDVHPESAWRISHQIRKAMGSHPDLLQGIIEMDETYVGGKPRPGSGKSKRGRGTNKVPVIGMVQRNGPVKAFVSIDRRITSDRMLELVRGHVDTSKGNWLLTDEFRSYNQMNKIVAHLAINHQESYADGDVHTNTIESFWAILKRGIIGQFHRVTLKYLQRYVDEFAWRFNRRMTGCAFDELIMEGLK